MNIREVNEGKILCEWFDKATVRSHTFLQSQLTHTNPEQLPVISINIGDKKDGNDTPPWERREQTAKQSK
jgi:hypothetical protein